MSASHDTVATLSMSLVVVAADGPISLTRQGMCQEMHCLSCCPARKLLP